MRMKIYHAFHNATAIFNVSRGNMDTDRRVVFITESQASRLQRLLCGVRGCSCDPLASLAVDSGGNGFRVEVIPSVGCKRALPRFPMVRTQDLLGRQNCVAARLSSAKDVIQVIPDSAVYVEAREHAMAWAIQHGGDVVFFRGEPIICAMHDVAVIRSLLCNQLIE